MFYQFIASLRQRIRDEVRSTSPVHKFVRALRDGGRLMRCYTQNIDGLESREGLVTDLARGRGNKRRFMKKHYEAPRPTYIPGTDFDGGCEVVQLHGDLDKLRCTVCSTRYEWSDGETEIYLEGAAPNCPKCADKSAERQASGKRGLAVGSLRPNIVLYGEDHPCNTLLTPLIPFDAGCQPEGLIIMGTSLKVFGLQKIVRQFAKAVHAHKNGKGRVIFVNRTRPAESVWEGIIDDFVAMDCDDWVDDLKGRRPDLWLRQGDLELTVAKSSQPKRKRKSAEEDTGIGSRPKKKAKRVVEIPSGTSLTQQAAPSTPSRKMLGPKRLKLPANYPGRAILSPLAQARRPPISPLTSPVRMDEEQGLPSPVRHGTPGRPAYSPLTSPVRMDDWQDMPSPSKRPTPRRSPLSSLTPGVLSGSKLKMEVFRDEPSENDIFAHSPECDGAQMQLLLEEETTTLGEEDGIGACRNGSTDATFQREIWERVRDGRFFSCSRQPDPSQWSTEDEDEVNEVETPSRGPRGRKIDLWRP